MLEIVFSKLERVHPICPSPNLDLLVVAKFVLIVHRETKNFPPPIECDINLVTPARDCDWACTISSCGELIAFYKCYGTYDPMGVWLVMTSLGAIT